MPLAILGNTPELSALELGVPWDGGQIAELPGTVDLQRLGGTVKLADVIGNDISDCLSILKSVPSNHKLVFGFSVYAGDHTVTTNQLAAYAKKLRDLGMHWKKQLKESGRSVRLVVSNEPTLSSVIVTKEHLLKDQTDFVVVLYQAKTVIGRTTAVQDYKEFSRRDYGRPQRDAFSGMLPPKVARMLVNIGTNRAHQSVETCHGMSLLDPFCGSGTIIQEALTLGFQHVIGSDISQKCIDDTAANLTWAKLPIPKLICTDVLKLSLPEQSIDVIVTEGYLGPVQPKRFTAIHAELTDFYQRVLPSLAKILKPGGRLVIALPSWNMGNRLLELPLDQVIAQAGFQAFHRPIYYGRHTAKVVRKIFFLYT